MRLTGLQERALVCLYRRAVSLSNLRFLRASSGRFVAYTDIDQAAGKGAQPDGEPYDLLRWDRMRSLMFKEVLTVFYPVEPNGHVRLTPDGCREAERRLE